jgi:hypothetical protein
MDGLQLCYTPASLDELGETKQEGKNSVSTYRIMHQICAVAYHSTDLTR